MKTEIAKELFREGESIIKGKIVFGRKEIFLRKVEFTLITNPEIAKNEKLVNIANSIQKGLITNKKLQSSNPEDINNNNLEIWLRKKMIERTINGKKFDIQEILEKFKKERGLIDTSNSDLIKKILSGEVILENKPIVEKNDYDNINDKTINKIEIIKNKLKTIKSIILDDIKQNFHFNVENLGDITPLIESINKSLRSINKESEILNNEFIVLKNELLNGLNGDEKSIKSSLFKISRIINNL